MATREADEYSELAGRIATWPVEKRLALAQRLLQTIEGDLAVRAPKKSLKDIVGLLAGAAPPPSDEDCKRILSEERCHKYGA